MGTFTETKKNVRNERTPECLAFIEEVMQLCKKHRCLISHEDPNGSFIIDFVEPDDKRTEDWFRDAMEETCTK